MRVYLLPGSTEQDRESRIVSAGELYQSSQYKLCRALVEKMGGNWLIVSPMHGLIWPAMPLKHYRADDMTNEEVCNRLSRGLTRDNILQTIRSMIGSSRIKVKYSGLEFVILGDTTALRFAADRLSEASVKVRTPLFGLTLHQQTEWIMAKTNQLPVTSRDLAYGSCI